MKTIVENRLFDTNEVCALLGISSCTLRKYRNQGLIKSVKIGRKHYVSESSLQEYINGQTEPKED